MKGSVRKILQGLFVNLAVLLLPVVLYAQPTDGLTGLLNTPTAQLEKDGTLFTGGNYLPQQFINQPTFDYNTGNYYFNLTFLPFVEVNARFTLFKRDWNDRYVGQDRTFGGKLRLLKEKDYLPALVFGATDFLTFNDAESTQHFGKLYGVATKNFLLAGQNLQVSIGYGADMYEKGSLEGVFGGLQWSLVRLPQLKIMAEYDTRCINAGAGVLLWKHLYLYSFAYDLNYIVGGVQAKIFLKTDPKKEKKKHCIL